MSDLEIERVERPEESDPTAHLDVEEKLDMEEVPEPGPLPKVLFFDVFGTCVDWRKSVTEALWRKVEEAVNPMRSSLNMKVRLLASNMPPAEWEDIAKEWRQSYLKFTRSIADDPSLCYKTVDQHQLDAFREIMTRRGLCFPRDERGYGAGNVPPDLVNDGSLFLEKDLREISRIWHYLNPWPDVVEGLRELNKKFTTCTLSNGNITLLEDMVEHGKMEFNHIFSAEMFSSYKPNRRVYVGAVEKVGLEPGECMMVAAHLDDLYAAKGVGLRTMYVERPHEERRPDLFLEGIVDVWVRLDENGFITGAEKLSEEK